MVKVAEYKSIGMVHGSLMLHELLHEQEITKHEEEIDEAAKAASRARHEEIVNSPDIRSERKMLQKEEGLCFKTFCSPAAWAHHHW